jgi:hypothetical protein
VEPENATEKAAETAVEPTAPAGPAPVLAGTFALYHAPDGGLVLVTDVPGRGVETRHVPGKVLRFVMHGPGSKIFGRLFGGQGEE